MRDRKAMASMSLVLTAMCGAVCAQQQSAFSASGDAQVMVQAAPMARGELIAKIFDKWARYVEENFQVLREDWAQEYYIDVSNASDVNLERAFAARTYVGMVAALTGDPASEQAVLERALAQAEVSKPGAIPKALGDADSDLVYVPVLSCRIVDTRIAGGPIAAGSTRDFDVTAVASYASQGGANTNCNVGGAGSFAVATLVISTPAPVADGTLTAFQLGTTQPVGASLAYKAGQQIATTAITGLDQSAAANEITVATTAATDVVIDIVGYFINPQATALQCIEKTGNVNDIGPGSFGSVSTANCDAGYTITGGGCSMSTFDGRVVTTRTIVDGSGQRHFCAFRNENTGSTDVNGVAYSRCCRTPGRL